MKPFKQVTQTEQSNEQIKFIEYHKPVLKDGEYTLTVTQTVNNLKGGKSDTLSPLHHKTFVVKGMQFILNPQLIYNQFPQPNASGDFSSMLPHILLKQTSLPWQRSGVKRDTDKDNGPWLALLVFHNDEIPKPEPKPKSIAEMRTNVDATTVFEYSNDPLASNEKDSDFCQYIELEKSLWQRVAPSKKELPLLAHVRVVSAANKPLPVTGLQESGDGVAAEQQYATVIANRLPPLAGRAAVHLVSLENLADYLPGGDGSKWNGKNKIRLASLAQWEFTTTASPYDFNAVFAGLNVDPLEPRLAADKNSTTKNNNVLKLGYVPMRYHLRNGDETLAWYRGPLTPYPVKKKAPRTHRFSDELLQFDANTGMFDVSYAAAWQTGRLLALADRKFVEAVLRSRKDNKQKLLNRIKVNVLNQYVSGSAATSDNSLEKHSMMHVKEVLSKIFLGEKHD